MSPIEALNAVGRWLVPLLGQLSLELVVLAAIVMAVLIALRVRSPRLRSAFWVIVLAKPVVSLLIASPMSLYWFLQPVITVPAPVPLARAAVVAAPRSVGPVAVDLPRVRYSRPPVPPSSPAWWQSLDTYGIAAAVWMVAASVLALRLFFGLAFVSFLRRTASPQRAGPLADAAQAAARALGMRRPIRVALSTVAGGPVLAGVLRPDALLPTRLAQQLGDDQLRLVIAHESAHARHRDNLFLLVQHLAEVLLFFHPIVWLCGWAMSREVESACDEAVVGAFRGVRAAYAGALVEVAALSRHAPLTSANRLLLNTFAASETGFTQRVRRVLDGGRNPTPFGLALVGVLALVAVGAVGLPRAAARTGRQISDNEGGAAVSEDSGQAAGSAKRPVRRQDGKVWIQGMEEMNWGGSFFTREDSQIRCLVEALRSVGRDVSYAELMGLSACAFKITMEPDLFVAAMHSEMGMDQPEVLRRVYGIDYQSDAISCSDEKNPGWPQKLRAAAAESIERGMPLFYMNGEWNMLVGYMEDGSGFLCMPYAGSEDGYKEMVKPGGFVGDIWFASVLREAGEPADRRESILWSLREAVELAGKRTDERGKRLFGFAAYEDWIAALDENRKDVSLHGNAFSYSQLLTSRQAATEYLRSIAEELGEDAAPHLRAAADRYEGIGQRLWDGRDCVKHPWDENWTLENRTWEAGLLRESLVDERAAVAEISAALQALGEDVPETMSQGAAGGPPSSVRQEGNKVWIEGLENTDWRQDSFMSGMTQILRSAGRDVSYEEVMGLSGQAFKLTMVANLHPGATQGHVGIAAYAADGTPLVFEPDGSPMSFHANAMRVFGLDWEHLEPLKDDENPDWRTKMVEFARQTIDQGIPFYYMDGEWNLIVGYREDGSAFVCKPHNGGYEEMARPRGPVGDVWWANIATPTGTPVPRREAMVQSLRTAAILWRTETYADGKAFSGEAGYEMWVRVLRDPPEDVQVHGNGFCYWQLLTSRQAAAEYLGMVADELGGDAEAPLRAAADRYAAIARRLDAGKDCVSTPWEESWTPQNRAREVEILRECLGDEQEAVAQLEVALRTLGEPVPDTGYANPNTTASSGSAAGVDGWALDIPQRLVLDDVPPARYGTPGHNPYGVCLASLLAQQGVDWTWSGILGYSGAGFRMNWNFRKWDEGNMDLGHFGAEPMRRGIQAYGYRTRFLIRQAWWSDETGEDVELIAEEQVASRFREAIVASINRGVPLLALGVVGPPEVSLITGYDEGGEALIGWSCFQGEHPEDQREPDGAYRQRNWIDNTHGIIVLEPGLPEDDVQRVRREALEWAYHMATLAPRPSHLHGLAAYEGWAEGMADDAAFPADLPETLQSRRFTIWDGLIMLADRAAAATFLEEEAERRPAVSEDLRAAAAAFRADGETGTRVNQAFGGPHLASEELLASTEARGEASAAILEARDHHREALDHLRTALLELGVPEAQIPPPTAGVSPLTGATTPTPGATTPDSEGARMLQGLVYPPDRVAAELACIEGALRYLDMDVSAAWLYGGTGHAFAIAMSPGAWIASPYAWQKTVYELGPNLGFRLTGIAVPRQEAGDKYPARQREAYDLVRDAIDRGLPCYADRVCGVPDYALVTGYDEVGYYYTHPATTGGPSPWQELGLGDIDVLDVWRVEPCEARSDEEAVRAALETVLARAATSTGWAMANWEDQVSGPTAFDLWADDVESGQALRDSHGYNAMFWCECREMAVAFLEEVKTRLPGRCDAALDQAIAQYRVVAGRLAEVRDLHQYVPEESDWVSKLQSPESAQLLRDAAVAERQGLRALADVLSALGGTPPEAFTGTPGGPRGGSAGPRDASRGPGPTGAQGTSTGGSGRGGSAGADLTARDADYPERLVLEGVKRMAHHTDRWRFTHFCHALDVSLQYLGEGDMYDRLMALSGAGLRNVWAAQMWDGGNSDPLGMAVQTLEPMRRAYWGAGYEMVPVTREAPDGWPQTILHADVQRLGGELTDEAGFRRRIIESIESGRPVIAFGVIGPPEACVITGYDEGGDVLIGWNEFQGHENVETEPSGYFRVRDWYKKTHGLLLLGEKVGSPPPDELYRRILLGAVEVLRTPAVADHAAGPAAFEAWAADMANDEYFPADNTGMLHARLDCHWDAMTMQAERATVLAFLNEAAEHEPDMAEHLGAAAAALQEGGVEHGVAPGERDQIARLADPEVRREVAESILATRDAYLKTADHLVSRLRSSVHRYGNVT